MAASNSGSSPPADTGTLDWRVRAGLARMAANLREPAGLTGLAREFRITPRHLSRLFVCELGRPPHAVLAALRIEEGERLLLDQPHLAVEEIAWRVGMDPSHFSRAFKARYGRGPADYRGLLLSQRRA
jgi:transcriptional regulator GlxA family with amidase domain